MVGMKTFVFFAICFIGGTFLSAVMEGQSAFATTILTSGIDESAITVEVLNTTDFLDADYIWIEDEKVSYTSKDSTHFLGVSRGLNDTDAVAHEAGAKVKNETTNIINNMLGYNVALTTSTVGQYAAPVMLAWNFIRSIPRMIAWDYSYLEGKWVMLKYFVLYPISIGFVVSLGLVFMNLAMGIFRR